ncbi:MAG: Gfo/Idh/MocA family oxidoreductase [Lentisphaerae bacterium]|jgi:UDP-N-acetyl-2-amino-2-deoxyglucuronate dehydrogenase|nr:Gfo/Idh/MocA family oxidoreductase [Lentisphaerota bacterium]MBT4818010.1 Gfo/Idh/MocA family oxidoreductase [Lentisphaerota bacterium]MBT5607257.1 Gfo/Idh/MocA family oxidoreductase [Lentisphaerota bacterium]MBT7058814.1 Gfo/Idh/MocA family oxidoreductase [Lentisphaerota bacterium]MBT7842376.1 Gfo/Idh/MocA family oxidoreductase [Lentisphaerota bacterium]
MERTKVAVIGCGGISRAHLNGHLACPGSEVIYCVDIIESRAREKAEVMGCKWHTDYLAILDEVDAVDICTPPHVHAEMTVEAARRGKHVLTEKIMARTLPEARWMIDECEKADVVFMVAFVLRYRPEFELFQQTCAEGKLGQIRQAYIQTQLNMAKPAEWRQNPYDFPMGAFLSHGCHYVDQLQWCVGPIAEAMNMSHALTLNELIPGGDDTNCAIFRHQNGAVSCYVESWAIPFRTSGIRYEVYGTEGSLQLTYRSDGKRLVTLFNSDGENDLFEFDPRKEDHMDAFGGAKDMQGQIKHFISCIQNRDLPLTHGREGIKPMQAVLAAEAAEREGRTLRINDFIERPQNTAEWSEPDFRAWVKETYGYSPE